MGFRSCANILEETSMAMTMSIPLVVLVRVEMSSICGLAKAVITDAKAKSLKTKSNGFNLVSQLDAEKALELDNFTKAICSLRVRTYHRIAIGMSNSNQKNSGFANCTLSNIRLGFLHLWKR